MTTYSLLTVIEEAEQIDCLHGEADDVDLPNKSVVLQHAVGEPEDATVENST